MSILKPTLIAAMLSTSLVLTNAQATPLDARVEQLLQQMTLEEKVGQLTQYSGDKAATGPVTFTGDLQNDIRTGKVGSMLNVLGARYTRQYQEVAMQSRLKIPMLFALDVIHGYQTTFPIPLAEAASWDLDAMRLSARIAATEAAAAGIHWTFAPMVDVTRDPRWGRVMEGAGEDPYLGAQVAAARVRGFQGERLGELNAVMATAKHFAGYGAVEGGREYNAVDMSMRKLWDVYLPPFRAAAAAGAASFMNAFNDLNGVPASGHRYLLRDVLKGQWGFDGVVVSDWASIGEMVAHGYVADKKGAALAGITAGSDVDMASNAYREELPALVAQGRVSTALLDDSVRRVLRKKFELGLFDDPYRFSNTEREQRVLNNPQHRLAARDVARKSIVLLKNENHVLPLSSELKRIALIGPMAKLKKPNHGAWAVNLPELDYDQFVVSQWEGLKNRLGSKTELLYAQGCDIEGDSKAGFAQALDVAARADVVLLSLGERWDVSGEARSRTDIHLSATQQDLVQAIRALGKPVVLLISAGRPLIFNRSADNADAILYTWWLGTEAGNAIADVLFGDTNPSAKLPMSFPRAEGQIPVYYNALNTGRPPSPTDEKGYNSNYVDQPVTARYPFGHGLSYTQFAYSDLQLSTHQLHADGAIELTLKLRNTGSRAGAEVVQLYLRDPVASLVRPIKELKGFQKVLLQPGETRQLRFTLNTDSLSFHNQALQWVAEPGEFELMVGASSADIRLRARFELLDSAPAR